MIKLTLNISLILFACIILSCEKRTYWETETTDQIYIIVEGIITNENINHGITLTLSTPEANSIPAPASGATVFVSDGQDTVWFSEDIIPGRYVSNTNFIAVVNKIYKLDILYTGSHVYGFSGMLPVTPDSHLTYAYNEDKELFYINSETAILNIEEAAMFELMIDWSHVPEYSSLPEDSTKAKQYYYSLKTLDVNQIFSPPREIVYFPEGTQIIKKKYSLTPEHEKFIRSVLIETQWSGGFFDVEEGNVFTNLSTGAFGYFGACSVVSDTITVE